jgi:pyruvate dehydrogenase E2 component (dihydrolipoyllysine-residue acetyltransferase)
MAFEVVLPRLGWNMEEGTLTGWRKHDGDSVKAGEVLFEVESDKAVQEVEALESGVLRIPDDSPAPGTTVTVGTVIAYLVQPGEQMPSKSAPIAAARDVSAQVTPRPSASSRVTPGASASARVPTAPVPSTQGPPGPAPGRRHPAISPRAKRVAAELRVEWMRLRGSGSTGRIVERDVRTAAAGTPAGAAAMSASARTPAPVTLTTEADASEMVRLRRHFTSSSASVVPSCADFVLKAAAFALQEHPDLNARFEQGSIVRPEEVHIGIALDAEEGLLVPVVHDVQSRTLMEIARETADLIERARSGGLRPEELGGGTFSIIDLGLYEIDAFTPVINLPECAVLGVGRIVARQVVVDAEAGTTAIRSMAALSLTFDQRLVESAPAARFLQRVKQCVEAPYLWLAGR